MGRVVHFEINADKPKELMNFYKKVFNWKFKKWEGEMEYWLIMTGDEKTPGIDGGLQKRENPNSTIDNFIDVDNINETIDKIQKNGGTIIVPRMVIPRVGYLAYFKDTDKNIFGIMERDESAK